MKLETDQEGKMYIGRSATKQDDEENLRMWVLDYMKNDTLPKEEFFRRADYLMNWIKTGEKQ